MHKFGALMREEFWYSQTMVASSKKDSWSLEERSRTTLENESGEEEDHSRDGKLTPVATGPAPKAKALLTLRQRASDSRSRSSAGSASIGGEVPQLSTTGTTRPSVSLLSNLRSDNSRPLTLRLEGLSNKPSLQPQKVKN